MLNWCNNAHVHFGFTSMTRCLHWWLDQTAWDQSDMKFMKFVFFLFHHVKNEPKSNIATGRWPNVIMSTSAPWLEEKFSTLLDLFKYLEALPQHQSVPKLLNGAKDTQGIKDTHSTGWLPCHTSSCVSTQHQARAFLCQTPTTCIHVCLPLHAKQPFHCHSDLWFSASPTGKCRTGKTCRLITMPPDTRLWFQPQWKKAECKSVSAIVPVRLSFLLSPKMCRL